MGGTGPDALAFLVVLLVVLLVVTSADPPARPAGFRGLLSKVLRFTSLIRNRPGRYRLSGTDQERNEAARPHRAGLLLVVLLVVLLVN